MLRGEFRTAGGLVIPNNITVAGSAAILGAAFRGVIPALSVALGNCVPDPLLTLADIQEPSATNGYARVPLAQGVDSWPVVGALNGESFVESKFFTFVAVGGPFNRAVNRLVLMSGDTPLAVSGAMPGPITIGPDTAELDRKFNYRIYLR